MNYSFNGSSEDLQKIISQAVRAALDSDDLNPTFSERSRKEKSNSTITSAPLRERGLTAHSDRGLISLSDRNSNLPKPSAKVLSGTPLASIVVAVCCSDCLTDDVKNELQKVEDQQIKIQIEEVDELDEAAILSDLIAPHQATFFPALSENVIAKTATGIFDEPLGRLLLQAIEVGKPTIAIAPEITSDLRTNSPALFRLRQNHRQKLGQFGVRLIEQKDISKVLLSTLPKSTFKDATPQLHSGNKQLLTAQDIEKAAKEGKSKLQIPYRSIITPLAKDRAKELNIVIDLKG